VTAIIESDAALVVPGLLFHLAYGNPTAAFENSLRARLRGLVDDPQPWRFRFQFFFESLTSERSRTIKSPLEECFILL
jgi:hypothetical protein